MAVFSPQQIAPALIDFVTERHLAILTLVRPDGRPIQLQLVLCGMMNQKK